MLTLGCPSRSTPRRARTPCHRFLPASGPHDPTPSRLPPMTSRNRVRLSQLSLALIAALAAAPVFAQRTSAGVGALVTDSSWQPVAAAHAVVTPVESGPG